MKPKWRFYSTKTRYTRLFVDLLLVFLLSPLAHFSPIFRYLISFLFFTTILLSINTLALSVRVVFFLRTVAAGAFFADIIIFPNSPELTALTSLISYICSSLFIIPAIGAIAIRIVNEERVNQDVLRGAICLYFLLGILWYFFYRIIFFFDPDAFSIPDTAEQGNLLIYFSFTTLTTLGYGDILPVNGFAMMLTNLEALVGQLFPAIFIAKLVSLYSED